MTEWKSRKGEPDRGAEPKAPIPVRVNVSDVTIEALAPILQENWRGVLLHRDELSAWFGSFDRYRSGKGGDCPNWLSIFGCETIAIDRKTGIPRTIYVPRPNVSICGTIQPGTLARVLTREYLENGLASRFLFARPPILPGAISSGSAHLQPDRTERPLLPGRRVLLRLQHERGLERHVPPLRPGG